jgi:hypothetical protein
MLEHQEAVTEVLEFLLQLLVHLYLMLVAVVAVLWKVLALHQEQQVLAVEQVLTVLM